MSNNNVFVKSGYALSYKLRHPIKEMKWFLRNVKFGIQRMNRGYCDADVWNLNYWFLETVPNMLKDLKESAHGYPGIGEADTPEKWKKLLDRMIWLFNEANEEKCSIKNRYEADWLDGNDEIKKKYFEEEKRISVYRDECKNEGFELFSKWFWHLWD